MFVQYQGKKALLLRSMLVALGIFATANARAEVFGGVNFPGGVSSFADSVVSYDPTFGGTSGPDLAAQTPLNSLGAPQGDYVSLGQGGRIILKFTNNSLTGSGTSALDLWIFEVGPDVEDTDVDISKDGTNWFSVGKVFGATSGIDIDAYGFGTSDFFSYIRLTDVASEGQTGSGGTVGADIDSVGAIASAPPVSVPEPSTLALLGVALAGVGLRKQRKPK